MKDSLSEIVFIIDRSGSMAGLEQETILGYNQFISKQKELPGEAVVSTILFDDQYEVLFDRVNINLLKEITEKEYYVRGLTALYDAIGKSINDIGSKLAKTKEIDRPSKVIFVIMTDGMENSSYEFSHQMIRKMIEHQRSKYSWEFIFLGANFDVENFADSINIPKDRSVKYSYSGEGILSDYMAINVVVSEFRSEPNKRPDDSWKNIVKQDN